MSTILVLSATLMAAAAAIRSTWSPCGLSMLSTITPLGERAKGHRYGATCAWFIAGAIIGGLALGAVAAVLADAVRSLGLSPVAAGSAGLVAALVVLVSDTGIAGLRLPVHHRQVNERWLDAYRPWVYGAGFGFQIGSGVATYITTTAVYLLVVLGALSGDPVAALVLGGAFGLVRGLAVGLTRRVDTPPALLGFHQRFASRLPWAVRGVIASALAVAVALALAVGLVPAVVATASVAVVAGVVRLASGRRRRHGAPDGEVGIPGVTAADRSPSVPVG